MTGRPKQQPLGGAIPALVSVKSEAEQLSREVDEECARFVEALIWENWEGAPLAQQRSILQVTRELKCASGLNSNVVGVQSGGSSISPPSPSTTRGAQGDQLTQSSAPSQNNNSLEKRSQSSTDSSSEDDPVPIPVWLLVPKEKSKLLPAKPIQEYSSSDSSSSSSDSPSSTSDSPSSASDSLSSASDSPSSSSDSSSSASDSSSSASDSSSSASDSSSSASDSSSSSSESSDEEPILCIVTIPKSIAQMGIQHVTSYINEAFANSRRPTSGKRATTSHTPRPSPLVQGKVKCTHQGCNQSFTEYGSMTRHVASIHGDGGDPTKPKVVYKCSVPGCKRTSTRKDEIVTHRRNVHAVGHKFLCDICGKRFKCKKLLNEHKSRSKKCKELKRKRGISQDLDNRQS